MPLDNWESPEFGVIPRQSVGVRQPSCPKRHDRPAATGNGKGIALPSKIAPDKLTNSPEIDLSPAAPPPPCGKPVNIPALLRLKPEEFTKHPGMYHMIECASCRQRYERAKAGL